MCEMLLVLPKCWENILLPEINISIRKIKTSIPCCKMGHRYNVKTKYASEVSAASFFFWCRINLNVRDNNKKNYTKHFVNSLSCYGKIRPPLVLINVNSYKENKLIKYPSSVVGSVLSFISFVTKYGNEVFHDIVFFSLFADKPKS